MQRRGTARSPLRHGGFTNVSVHSHAFGLRLRQSRLKTQSAIQPKSTFFQIKSRVTLEQVLGMP